MPISHLNSRHATKTDDLHAILRRRTGARSPNDVWFNPTSFAPDLADLFTHSEKWATARSFSNTMEIPSELLLNNTVTLAKLIKVDAFRLWKASGGQIAVVGPGLKEWDCVGDKALAQIMEAVKNIRANGGEVVHVAMDEPMMNTVNTVGRVTRCNLGLEESAKRTANYIKTLATEGIQVGDIEAYPTCESSNDIDVSSRREGAPEPRRRLEPSFLRL